MLPNSFSIGPLTLHVYGLVIAAAVALGWYLAKKRAAIYKIPKNIFDDFIIIIPLILGIIGARIYHVLDYWFYYSHNPGQIILVNNGGLGVWGGVLGIIVGIYLIARIKKINPLSFLDLISPSIILGQAIGRIGNYINQEGFGPPTNLPWGVYIDSAHRPQQYMFFNNFHPTFFYEAVLNLIAFYILIFLSNLSSPPPSLSSSSFRHSRESGNRDKLQRGSRFSIESRMTFAKPGQILGLYLILYGIIRFITEFWRIDTAIVGEIKAAHILSLISILIGIFLVKAKSLSFWSKGSDR